MGIMEIGLMVLGVQAGSTAVWMYRHYHRQAVTAPCSRMLRGRMY